MNRQALAALDAARPAIARLDRSRTSDELSADLIQAWSGVETGIRSLLGGSPLSGQDLIREARNRQMISFDQANALAEFQAARERSTDGTYHPTDADINAVMARMAQTSSVAFIRSVNRNLTSLTMSSKAEDRPEQKAAVERLKTLVAGAQAVIGQMTSANDNDDTSVEIFTVLSTQRAVWKYWQDILYAWAGATTLDFAPLFFMASNMPHLL